MDGEISELKSLVSSMREDLNELLRERNELRDKVWRLEDTVGRLGDSVLDLATKDTDLFGETAQGGEASESSEADGRPGTWSRDAPNPENEHVTVPDTFELQGLDIPRKSIEYTPERTNAHQLHEFDDAPSVGVVHLVASASGSSGTSSGSGHTVTLKLVDPDGNTAEEDTSCKWMVPLRQADGNGKVLHWARIGKSVTFDVGSIVETPCPPTIEATLSGNSVVVCVHSYEKVDGNCVEVSGSPECVTIPLNEFNLNCEDVRDCVNDERTVLTGVTNTGSGLVFTRERIRVASHVAESSVTIDGTTCESSGES